MKVSIVMPTYNAARFVAEAVGSVQRQSFNDWELIIVDDGSTDATPSILAKICDPRIRIIRQPNGGVSKARNTGLEHVSGDFVTFLDADDLLPPDALDVRVRYLEAHPNISIVNGRIRVTRNGTAVRTYDPEKAIAPLFPRLARLEEGVFFGPFYMIRRSAIGAHRFPAGVSHCEDLIFFLELAHDGDLTYGAVDADVYEYRLHPNSAMANLSGIEAGYLTLLRRAGNLSRMSEPELRELRQRIASILVKSWLRRWRPLHAVSAGVRALVV